MTIDKYGRIEWLPQVSDLGTHPVTVTVTDPFGAFVTQSYTLLVDADLQAPRTEIVTQPNPAAVDEPIAVVVTASDNIGIVSLTLTANGDPVPLDARGRATLQFAQPGVVTLLATATDAAGNLGQKISTLIVADPRDAEAPFVELTSPDEHGVVTAPTDVIGTVRDNQLVYYTLGWAPFQFGDFTEFARGTSAVENGILGRFDPTLLSNDSYVIRLTAVDAGGHVSVVDRMVNVAGELKLGNFTLSFTDLSIPLAGVPIQVSRTYDTLQASLQGDFGYGWELDFRNTGLRTNVARTSLEDEQIFNPFYEGARVYLREPGGKRVGFTFKPKLASERGLQYAAAFGLSIYNPYFEPDPGVTSQLTVRKAYLVRNAGSYYDFAATGLPYNPAIPILYGDTYTLTTRGGVAYTIGARTGQLQNAKDRNGNRLDYTDAGIFSSTGQQVTFTRDPQGRIVLITDPAGHSIHYTYDSQGDLVSVTDREGATNRFAYSTAQPHYMTQAIGPLGGTGIRTEYDAEGRLLRMIEPNGTTVELNYDPDNSAETVLDGLGNPTRYEYDTRGNIVAQIDAEGGITRSSYDANNRLLAETNPLGSTTSFVYDAAGNLLSVVNPQGRRRITPMGRAAYPCRSPTRSAIP